MNKETFLNIISKDDRRGVEKAYHDFKPKFTGWFFKVYKNLNEEEVLELYQRSFTILYYKGKNGELNEITVALETYLIGIGKYVVRSMKRENAKLVLLDDEEIGDIQWYTESFDDSEERVKVKNALNKMEEPCKSILQLFYLKRFSMEAIANNLGYKNEGVAKKKKYQCLKKLKEILGVNE